MEMKNVFLLALVITVVLLSTIVFVNKTLDRQREKFIERKVEEVNNAFNEMQSLMLMGDVYGDRMICLIFNDRLKELDESVWETGRKIEQYRIVSEEFFKSPFYRYQKEVFNEKEVFYLHLLKVVKQKCNFTQPIILFFYKNSKECKKCDDQSFVLRDINKDIDEEISVFSFDMDINLTTLNILNNYYNIDQYPCLVIEDRKFCGM
ncbi:MAG: hypothetical protein AABY14_02770 [Nanoarchaeota archaeon]